MRPWNAERLGAYPPLPVKIRAPPECRMRSCVLLDEAPLSRYKRPQNAERFSSSFAASPRHKTRPPWLTE
jgi:hypothetical protein